MKLPGALTRTFARQIVLVQKHAPTILWAGGVACGIGATVSACRSTLRLEPIINQLEVNLKRSNLMHKDRPQEYSAVSRNKDRLYFYGEACVGIAKLYAPAIILGSASIVMLASGQSILVKRNAGLTAAYATLLAGFDDYRSRVVAEYGEEKDREFRYGSEERTIVEDTNTGPVKKRIRTAGAGRHKDYVRLFGPGNPSWGNIETSDVFFLSSQQDWLNDKLHARGHLFLNEAYDHLNFERTPAGAVTGWIYDPRNPERQGDGEVDFGCFAEGDPLRFLQDMVGEDGSIIIDFNVDGPIWDKI